MLVQFNFGFYEILICFQGVGLALSMKDFYEGFPIIMEVFAFFNEIFSHPQQCPLSRMEANLN